MAVSVNTNSTSTAAIVGTDVTLATITAAGIYELYVQLNNLVAGDIVELRAWVKAYTGATEYLAWGPATYGPLVPSVLLPASPAIVSPISVRFSLKQVAGTARNFGWSVVSTGA